jgi:L-ascorbate metabolism protein UlaG (beta-lactamase superfamily)
LKPKPKFNPDLPFIKKNWEGNPLDEKGLYRNLYERSEKGFSDLLSWQIKGNAFKKMKIGQKTNVDVRPIHFEISALPQNAITWLGHATFLYRLDGLTIITDPVLDRVGPIKRMTPLPLSIDQLIDIDLILVSHNHRDHLDEKSMKTITRLNPDAVIYTGLGIATLLKSWKIKNTIIEAGWYQEYPLKQGIQVTYLPAKHWNRRYLTDLNTMAWGSMMIQSKTQTIYFAADSGIDIHFDEIAKLFPSIDYASIGIGAYEPNWFMQPAHTSPIEAIEVAKKLKCRNWIPMHYGTFDLSDEPIFLPKNVLIGERDTCNARIVDIGELVTL